MWSYGAIEPSWTIEIASEDNPYENLWILWRHVKFKKCKSCIINHIPWLKCLIFLCFWVELWKTFENDGQGIKISIRMKKCHFWVKKCCFYQKRKWNFEKLWFLLHMVLWPYSISVSNFRTIWSIFWEIWQLKVSSYWNNIILYRNDRE